MQSVGCGALATTMLLDRLDAQRGLDRSDKYVADSKCR